MQIEMNSRSIEPVEIKYAVPKLILAKISAKYPIIVFWSQVNLIEHWWKLWIYDIDGKMQICYLHQIVGWVQNFSIKTSKPKVAEQKWSNARSNYACNRRTYYIIEIKMDRQITLIVCS